MSSSDDDRVRDQIGALMGAGLKTQTEPFPETDKEFGKLLTEVRDLAPDDLQGKLVLTGFVDKLSVACPMFAAIGTMARAAEIKSTVSLG